MNNEQTSKSIFTYTSIYVQFGEECFENMLLQFNIFTWSYSDYNVIQTQTKVITHNDHQASIQAGYDCKPEI